MAKQKENSVKTSENSLLDRANFSLPIRVYYEDTDAGGVVYHSNYINFFERARTEWIRDLGIEQDTLLSEHHLAFVVRKLDCEYIKPALFNDELFVTVDIIDLRKATVVFKQQILRASKNEEKEKHGDHVILAKGEIMVAAVDTIKFKPKRLPEFFTKQIKEDNK